MGIKNVKKYYKFIFAVLLGLIVACHDLSAQSTVNIDSSFTLNFDNGFKKTLLIVKDSSCKKILFKGQLTSNEILGYAKGVLLNKYYTYWILVDNKKYIVEPKGIKYGHVNYYDKKITIIYLNKKILYQ